jgi:hypothetical protein
MAVIGSSRSPEAGAFDPVLHEHASFAGVVVVGVGVEAPPAHPRVAAVEVGESVADEPVPSLV